MSATVSCAKTAEPIEMIFAILTWVSRKTHVLDGGAHWRHLANTIDASCAAAMQPYQIILTTSYH